MKLDPAMIDKVKAGKPGERFFVDRNGDGKNDEVWYIDTQARHTKSAQPLLVRAIDEDGDLDRQMGPDLDSDLYVADMGADGRVDSVLDYTDVDGDGDLDEMAFYFYMPHHPFFGDDVLRVWWGRDDGDDNLLWYDVNYNYDQNACQYRCHFSGDESFVAFGLKLDSTEWLSAFENPFLFYDPDKDRCSEVVLRVEGQADKVRSVRYSFDADDDARGRRTHDYDFSITAVAAKDQPVQLTPDSLIRTKLRDFPTQGWLDRDRARSFAAHSKWDRAVLTWDEMNANTEQNVQADPNERWEGIIAHASRHFAQVGGPPCSALNKRNEVALFSRPGDKAATQAADGTAAEATLALYYDTTDRRLHLQGASEGWIDVDYNFDEKVDARYVYIDDDQDGRFDRRQIDLDADGTPEYDWKMNPRRVQPLELDFAKLRAFYGFGLPKILSDSQRFIDAARLIAPELKDDPVARYFVNDLVKWMPKAGLGKRIRSTPAGARYYSDLIRDRAFHAVARKLAGQAALGQVELLYASGDYAAAADALIHSFAQNIDKPNPSAFRSFARRIGLIIDTGVNAHRDDWPVVIGLDAIKRVAPDFNPANCAVVAPPRWIEWRQVPHQIDEIDPARGRELSFMADLPPGVQTTWYLYYSPSGQAEVGFPSRTGTAEDWVPPNIGWESNRCAYRAYWGQFDFFGKKTDDLIYPTIGKKSYHDEVEWGIDALHVGTTSGLGGLTLYRGGHPFLVQNPAGKGDVKFTKRVLTSGPVRAAVQLDALNIIPDDPNLGIRMTCVIYADRQETEVRAQIQGKGENLKLAPGLVKLPREESFEDFKSGVLGSWGCQQEVIGDIGMAIIVPTQALVDTLNLPEERRIRCKPDENGALRYWLIGDWRRGRQHPVAPTVENWHNEVNELSALLQKDVKVKLGAVEKAD